MLKEPDEIDKIICSFCGKFIRHGQTAGRRFVAESSRQPGSEFVTYYDFYHRECWDELVKEYPTGEKEKSNA